MTDPSERLVKATDLTPDPHNPRRHTARNIGMIVDSLQQFGAARGIVIDENDRIMAGNGVWEAALEAGIDQIKVVPVSGNEIVAIQVSHLTEDQKRQYAVYDNRSGEEAKWNTEELRDMQLKQIMPDNLWFSDEFDRLMRMDHSAYEPALKPIQGTNTVTANDMNAAADKLDGKFSKTKDLVPVICPHCATEFYLDRE